MTGSPIDTNVIIRFLVETPSSVPVKFKGVFSFFRKVEQEEIIAHVPDLVVFQSFFVLTSYYEVPASVAADKLIALISFRGIRMPHKHVMLDGLSRVRNHADDLVDAWLVAWSKDQKNKGIYSFDTGLKKSGLELLPVE